MRASKLLKLPVMAMREGLEQGQVVDMVVDPEKKKVSHYIVRKGSRYDLLLVAATEVRGIGTGYLVVPDGSVVRRIFGDARRMEIVARGFYLTDAQVISDAGIALGGIIDYDFDPRTTVVTSLILENGAQYPASQIVGLSGTTVFVSGGPMKTGAPMTPVTPANMERRGERHSRQEQPAAAMESFQQEQPLQQQTVMQPQQSARQQQASATPVRPQTLNTNFTRPAPSVSAQVRKAYRPEPVSAEKKTDDPFRAAQAPAPAAQSSETMVKPPNVLRRLLVGKRLADSVASTDGIFSLPAGTVITEWHMQLAEQHDAVQQLMKHVEPG